MGEYHIWNIVRTAFVRAIVFVFVLVSLCAPVAAQEDDAGAQDLILAVVYTPYTLSPGLLGAEKNGQYYLPVLELADIFDFYIESELERGYIHGYIRDEKNSYSIDLEKKQYEVRGEIKPLPDDAVLADPFGEGLVDLFVIPEIINELWPVELSVNLSGLALEVVTEEKLPFELRLERKEQRAIVEGRKQSLSVVKDLPFVPNPYKWLGLPAADFETEISWDNESDKAAARTTISGVQDLAKMSLDYTATGTYQDGVLQKPDSVRTRFSREAFGEDSLPGRFRKIEFGDVRLNQRNLIGNGEGGRGVFATTYAQKVESEFDLITVEGIGLPGWEVEVYRNEQLVDFGFVDETGEYRFENVPLNIGNNQIRIVLYGPQGQIQEKIENYNIGSNMVEPGKTEYTAGFVDVDRPFFPVELRDSTGPRGFAKNAFVAHGLSENLTLFGSAADLPTTDGDKKYVTAGAATSILGGLAQAELYGEVGGGKAIDVRYLTELKGIRLNLQSAFFNEFNSPDAGFDDTTKTYEGEFRASTTLKTFLGAIGLQLNTKHLEKKGSLPQTNVDFVQTLNKGSLRLTHQTDTVLSDFDHSTSSGKINATVRVNRWQFRSQLDYSIYPDDRLNSIQGDVRYRGEDGFSAAVSAQQDFVTSNFGTGFQIGYDFKRFLGSLDLNWEKEGGLALVARASSSLGPYGKDGKYTVLSNKLSKATPVQGRVFMDRDGDGVFSEGDEPVEDARISINGGRAKEEPDEEGIISVTSAAASDIVDIEVDKSFLSDPYYRPGIAGYSTVLRPGSMPQFDFPIIETGSIDGTVMREDGNPISGMRLELVNEKDEVVMDVETAYDGFYTFEFVPPGTYTVRADPSYGVHVPPETVTVTSDDLFAYGIDLQLLEQAEEVEADGDSGALTEGESASSESEEATESGEVAHTYHESSNGTEQPAPLPPEGGLSAFVKRVRIGEHPDRVRLVMDLSGSIAYHVNEAQGGSVITIDLPNVAWNALTHWRAHNTPILQSFEVQALEGGKGTRLVLKAHDKMKLGLNGVLPPQDEAGHRLYIDLQAQ